MIEFLEIEMPEIIYVTRSANLAISDTLGMGGGLFSAGEVTRTNVTVTNKFATTYGGIFRSDFIPVSHVRMKNTILEQHPRDGRKLRFPTYFTWLQHRPREYVQALDR